MSSKPKLACSLCSSPVDGRHLASPQKLENRILDLIKQDRPDWEAKRGICPNCVETYRAKVGEMTMPDAVRQATEHRILLVATYSDGRLVITRCRTL